VPCTSSGTCHKRRRYLNNRQSFVEKFNGRQMQYSRKKNCPSVNFQWPWMTFRCHSVWLVIENILVVRSYTVIQKIGNPLYFCNNFFKLFEILLFCSVNTGCFVEYNTCYVLHFVTAIILRHTKYFSSPFVQRPAASWRRCKIGPQLTRNVNRNSYTWCDIN